MVLRFIGVMNAALWFGAALFFTFAIAPAFSSPEMKRLLGGCLQAIGIMIAGLSGICTLMGLATVSSLESFGVFIWSALYLCISVAVGVGLYLAGRVLIRDARNDRD